MPTRLAALLVAALAGLLAACGSSQETVPAEPSSTTAPEPATTELVDGAARIELTVELADTSAERSRGLSGRESLPADRGMLFVNDDDVTTSFHMEGTTIPLSLAFIAADGEIVALVDMEPCKEDPCPAYAPPGPYRFGLEVNQGAFERWGISTGGHLLLPE